MAINIDISSDSESIRRLREREAKERKTILRCVKIALAAIIAAVAVAAAVNAIGIAGKISDVSDKYAAAQAEFDEMKAQAAANEAAAASGAESDTSGTAMIDRDMYSARNDGQRVCELLELAYREGGLIVPEDAAEFRTLTGTPDALWFGSGLDPAASPLKWEFLTWYDSTDGHNYKTAWGCYAPDGNGVLSYLLFSQYANYDGESGKFSLEGSYTTSFGEMYLENGYIERTGPSGTASEVIGIADQLGGGSGNETDGGASAPGVFPAANGHSGGSPGAASGTDFGSGQAAGQISGSQDGSAETRLPSAGAGATAAGAGVPAAGIY